MQTMIQNSECRIAVVEDETSLRDDLVEYLQWRGFAVQGFESAEAIRKAWSSGAVDLAILDICLPGDSGLQVAQWLRARHRTIGIVMLTALGEDSDQVKGLKIGADAYLVKGASLALIEATCLSVLRRLADNGAASSEMQVATLSLPAPVWNLHCKSWQLVLPSGAKFALTHTETLFLQCLLRQPGTPVSRTEILTVTNKTSTIANLRNLDNCASRLRRKILKECAEDIPIRPSYGHGYTFTGEGKTEEK